MRRLLPIAVLLSLLSTLGYSSVPVRIRVLTYNIHHGEGTDGRFDLPRLASIMMAAEPDLVALQEVDQRTERVGGTDQLAELASLTGMHGAFGQAMSFQGGAYGVGVLSRYPLLQVENRALPESPDREPRTVLTVDVQVLEHSPIVQFASTHLDQGRDQTTRLVQAGFLNALLASESSTSGILAGDMNSRPDTEVMQILSERWMNPTALLIPVPPPERPRGLVDHVLVRPAPEWRPVEVQVINDRLASDHRPLLVVLEWTPDAARQKP